MTRYAKGTTTIWHSLQLLYVRSAGNTHDYSRAYQGVPLQVLGAMHAAGRFGDAAACQLQLRVLQEAAPGWLTLQPDASGGGAAMLALDRRMPLEGLQRGVAAAMQAATAAEAQRKAGAAERAAAREARTGGHTGDAAAAGQGATQCAAPGGGTASARKPAAAAAPPASGAPRRAAARRVTFGSAPPAAAAAASAASSGLSAARRRIDFDRPAADATAAAGGLAAEAREAAGLPPMRRPALKQSVPPQASKGRRGPSRQEAPLAEPEDWKHLPAGFGLGPEPFTQSMR